MFFWWLLLSGWLVGCVYHIDHTNIKTQTNDDFLMAVAKWLVGWLVCHIDHTNIKT
jgi:hypothetical protein